METKKIAARHDEWKRWADCLDIIDLLYCGGESLRTQAAKVLVKRPKELQDVYQARCQMFNYQNVLGPSLGWYEAALFAEQPTLDIRVGDKPLEDEPYADFVNNCDRRGTVLYDFLRRVFLDAVLFRRAFVLVDAPAASADVRTLADQRAAGALAPYLVRYDPRQVINWAYDDFGNLLWLVIETDHVERTFAGQDASYRLWRYYNRAEYRTFRAEIKDGKPEDTAREIARGAHTQTAAGVVPFAVMELPDSLWFGNRAYLPALAHLNKTNALDWGLFTGCLPIPYVKGRLDSGTGTPKVVSETAYLELEENGEAGYIEPSGAAWQAMTDNIASLREELYRQLHLQSQGRSTEATPAAQSGFSKEMDMAPARDILGKFGDTIRETLTRILGMVSQARGERDMTFSVRGYQFADVDAQSGIDIVKNLEASGCPSPTLVKAAWKQAAREVSPDQPAEFYAAVDTEIDAGVKSPEEKADEEIARQKDLMGAKLKERVAA